MALTLKLQADSKCFNWRVPEQCVSNLGKVNSRVFKQAADIIFGNDKTSYGAPRVVGKDDLLRATLVLLKYQSKSSKGFRVRETPHSGNVMIGKGLSGIKIDGRYYAIDCIDDYWIIWSKDQYCPETGLISSERRYEEVEMHTDNMGTIYIENARSNDTEMEGMLKSIHSYVMDCRDDFITIVIG